LCSVGACRLPIQIRATQEDPIVKLPSVKELQAKMAQAEAEKASMALRHQA
jgi:hypothetical protein